MGFLASANAAAKHSGSTPVPPYQGLAEKQSRASRPNWSGPTGGQQWTYGPDGQPTMSVTSPYQGAFDKLGSGLENAVQYDPGQARDEAVQQNLDYGMSRLEPMFANQNAQFTSGMANQGLDPGTEAYTNANRALGQRQSDAYATVMTNAINQGNETERTGFLGQMVPFSQLGALTQATYAHPFMGEPPDYTGAAKDTYNAQRNNAAIDQQNMQNAANSFGQTAGKLGGK